MGILNVTPDSFFDGGSYQDKPSILRQAAKMIEEGARIIDVGAYSTRPHAEDISEDEELKRLIPAIKLLRNHFKEILISADTFRSRVAEACIRAGADIINDVSGGRDPEMFGTVAEHQVPYILMHMQGTPQTMQDNPIYSNVVAEIKSFFKEKLDALYTAGAEEVILDPGFGFGKTVAHNYELLNNLQEFADLGCPVLAGISRKSMINKVLNISAQDALNGTTVLNTVALLNGAKILRVHDVREAKETIQLINKLKSISS
ncbi:MAG: dihydropteroate synthase [Flavobacteriales bacterium]|nr:dihydropteroate synthase [Flavobacteriales bacterium]